MTQTFLEINDLLQLVATVQTQTINVVTSLKTTSIFIIQKKRTNKIHVITMVLLMSRILNLTQSLSVEPQVKYFRSEVGKSEAGHLGQAFFFVWVLCFFFWLYKGQVGSTVGE